MNYKEITRDELKYIFQGIDFKTPPMLHQLQVLAWLMDGRDRACPLLDIGTGKTLTSLYAAKLWGAKKTLIICPNSTIKSWREQIELHTNLSYQILQGTKQERLDNLAKESDLYIINYRGLSVLWGEKEKLNVPIHGKKTRYIVDYKAIGELQFDCVIIDECHALQSKDTDQTKTAHAISMNATNVIMMTGTPISTSIDNLWGQYWVLTNGDTFDKQSFYAFHNAYFKKVMFGPRIAKWFVSKEGRKKILEKIAPITIHYSREECFELPEKVYQERTVSMSDEQGKCTQKVIETVQKQLEEGKTGTVALLNQGNKLSQIVGGFRKDATGNIIRLKQNPKLDCLFEVLKEVAGKTIIFHEYVEEGRMISERCKKEKIAIAELRGEIKNKDDEYARFKADENCRVLVAHPLSGGVGLNLQEASTCIFFSNGYSGAVIRKQCEGRIWRAGQDKKCLFIDLVMEGSIDEKKLSKLGDRAAMAKGVLHYIQEWGK